MPSRSPMRQALALAALLLTMGCVRSEQPLPAGWVEIDEDPAWLQLANPADIDRLDRLAEAWTQALDEARSGGFQRAIEEEGPLLEPGAALPRPAPSPGPYRCRMIKIGTQHKGGAFNAFKPFFCYVEVEGDLLNIVKQTGSQRPAGWLYDDSDEERLVFLGTLALGTEEAPLPYGQNPERDMAGVLERVAPFRYRLVIPWPRQDSKLDVIELVPVTQ